MCIPKDAWNNDVNPPYQSLQQSWRYFRAKMKVTWLWLLFAIEYAYPADRVTKRSVYRSSSKVISYSPGSGRPAILKLPSFWIVTNHWICATQQNCIYTDLTSLSLTSTRVIALVPTSTSASIKLISVLLVWSRGIRCAYWDHEEKRQKVCFVTHNLFFKRDMGLP